MMKSSVIGTALVVSVTLALTACGGAKSASNSPGQHSGAGAQPSSGQAPPSQAPPSQTGKINVCTALPAATASRITGTTFTTAEANSVEGVVFGCDYSGPNSALLQVSVDVQGGKQVFAAEVSALKAAGHPPNAVSGVGDEAFSEPNPQGNAGSIGAAGFASYGAVFGDTYIKIGGLTYVPPDQGKQIVDLLHASL